MSRVFPTKVEATDWAAVQESKILKGDAHIYVDGLETVRRILLRYLEDITPGKKAAVNEANRIKTFMSDPDLNVHVRDLNKQLMAKWIRKRSGLVSGSSVVRECKTLSSIFNTAKNEWGAINDNPLEGVKRPKHNDARDHLITADEFAKIKAELRGNMNPESLKVRAFLAFAFAMQTAMRANELLGLTVDDIDGNVARIKDGKTGKRSAALSTSAVALIKPLMAYSKEMKFKTIFGMTSSQLDSNWRKLRNSAGLKHIMFRDSRHRAITDMAAKLSILELKRVVGNSTKLDLYFNKPVKDIADSLG